MARQAHRVPAGAGPERTLISDPRHLWYQYVTAKGTGGAEGAPVDRIRPAACPVDSPPAGGRCRSQAEEELGRGDLRFGGKVVLTSSGGVR
jgi:hypothetical protein